MMGSNFTRQLAKLFAVSCGLVLLSTPAMALEVSGKVVAADGKPLPFVRIRIGAKDAVPFTTSVIASSISGAHGAFIFPGSLHHHA